MLAHDAGARTGRLLTSRGLAQERGQAAEVNGDSETVLSTIHIPL